MMLQANFIILNNILISMPTPDQLKQLSESLEGTLLYDDLHKTLCTDRFCIPDKLYQDVVKLVRFAESIKFPDSENSRILTNCGMWYYS
jgi:hypothetical protein